MVDIRKYKKEIRRKIMINDDSLSGCTAYCFIENDKIIKIYKYPFSDLDVDDLSSCVSERISFPYEYIKKRRYYLGEVLPYFNVNNIMESIQNNCNIDKMMNHYNIIVKEIKKYPNIIMHDLSVPNILYDDVNGFFLIDVTFWKKIKDNVYNSFVYNLNSLNDSLTFAFYDFLFMNGYDLIMGNNEIEEMIKKILGLEFYELYLKGRKRTYDFPKLMEMYREIMVKKYNILINNTEDMKKSIKILKKT